MGLGFRPHLIMGLGFRPHLIMGLGFRPHLIVRHVTWRLTSILPWYPPGPESRPTTTATSPLRETWPRRAHFVARPWACSPCPTAQPPCQSTACCAGRPGASRDAPAPPSSHRGHTAGRTPPQRHQRRTAWAWRAAWSTTCIGGPAAAGRHSGCRSTAGRRMRRCRRSARLRPCRGRRRAAKVHAAMHQTCWQGRGRGSGVHMRKLPHLHRNHHQVTHSSASQPAAPAASQALTPK